MKKLILVLLPLLATSCSDPGASDSMPFFVRFVVQDEEGSPITEDVSVTFIENGEEKLIEDLEIETWHADYPGDTFATHWESLFMADRASSRRTKDFYLKYNGYTDTLTLLYKDEGGMDYHLFLLNGEEIKRDMSKLWPHNYITVNKK